MPSRIADTSPQITYELLTYDEKFEGRDRQEFKEGKMRAESIKSTNALQKAAPGMGSRDQLHQIHNQLIKKWQTLFATRRRLNFAISCSNPFQINCCQFQLFLKAAVENSPI